MFRPSDSYDFRYPDVSYSRTRHTLRYLVFHLKKRLLIALALLAMVGLIAWLASRRRPEAQVFRGASVADWARQCRAPLPAQREEATAALKACGSNAVPGLVNLLTANDGLLRRVVWTWVPKLPGPLAKTILRSVRPLDAVTVRIGAAHGLAAIGPAAAAAVPALAGALQSSQMELRWEAGLALGQIGGPAVGVLAPALNSTNKHVRHCAISGLNEMAGADALPAAPALLIALEDRNGIAVSAATCLSKLGTNVVPFLTNEMASPDPLVRRRAAHGLGAAHPRRTLMVPPLLAMLQDKEPACRLQALRELAMLGLPDRNMVKAYAAALDDSDAEVRLAAVQTLAQARFHTALAVPKLTAALADPSAAVRAAAAQLLGVFAPASQSAYGKLDELLGDQNESVRTAARQALAKLEQARGTNTASAPQAK